MEPTDLSDEELQYEISIRGINADLDRRTATKALRSDLANESKGVVESPAGKLPRLIAQEWLTHLEERFNGLLKEMDGARSRKDENARGRLTSKINHYIGRINRLEGSDAEEVRRIEVLQKIIKDINEVNGAIPKQLTNAGRGGAAGGNADIGDATGAGAVGGPSCLERIAENLGRSIINNRGADLVDLGITDAFENNSNRPNGNHGRNSSDRDGSRRTGSNENHFKTQGLNNEFSWGFGETGLEKETRKSLPPQFTHRAGSGQSNRNFSGGQQALNPYALEYRTNDVTNNSGIPHPSLPTFAFEQNKRSNEMNLNAMYSGQGRRYESYGNTQPSRGEGRPNERSSMNSQWNRRYNQGNRVENPPVNAANNRQTQQFQSRRRNPVAEWNITFSGENNETSLNDFLSRVELLARAEKVSDDDLLSSAVYLFTGSASIWFRAFNPYFCTWDQLVDGLKTQFLPVDYDFWLLKELEQRRQGDLENFGLFFASMEMMFRNLSFRLSEQQKLAIVMRNMLPMYSDRLALEEINSLPQLAARCKRIEEVRYRNSRQGIPQIHRRDLLEPAFSYQGQYVQKQRVAELNTMEYEGEPDYVQVAQVTNQGQRTNLCYNCGTPGHQFSQCRAERKLFCYRCGLSGYVTRTCTRCNKDVGNAGAGYNQGARMNSQPSQNQARQ